MRCSCSARMKCTDTREMPDGNTFRRHTCPTCGRKIKTVEQDSMLAPHEKIRTVSSDDWLKSRILELVTRAIHDA